MKSDRKGTPMPSPRLAAALAFLFVLASCAVPDGPPAATDPSRVELLSNRRFDNGAVAPWTQSSEDGYAIITDPTRLPFPAHSGGYAAWFGGYFGARDVLSQEVAVPANAAGATLKFYVRTRTEHGPGSPPADVLTVAIEDAGGAVLHEFATVTNRDATDQWERVKVEWGDVASLAGADARLVFRATGDPTGLTSFFVDTVSLVATLAPAP
jgi:hypothetical protein